jgi:twitching motility protein PilT
VSEQDPILEAALQNRLITRKQHGIVLDEIASRGMGTAEILLAHRFLTTAQLEKLIASLGGTSDVEKAGARPTQMGPVVMPPTVESIRSASPKTAQDAAPQASGGPPHKQPRTLKDMLRLARHWGASDLHVTVGRPPFVRINGQIRYMEMDSIDEEKAEILNFSLMTPEQREEIVQSLNLDFAVEIPGVGRHRCNVFRQRLGWDGVYRIVASRIPTIEELGLPPICRTLTEYHQGLVLVTGPARSGKTTTIAAMVDLVNRSREDHIVAIEDPIEYVHQRQKCQITQREVGRHTRSFAASLRAALREDPDIIIIGELRDRETISISISAAETGHLVFGSLHTGSAARTVSRILDVFPLNQQDQIAVMISESMRGIISQRLLPRADKQGLVLAMEILVVTSGVSTLIRDRKTHQLVSSMQSGRKIGMQTMDDALMDLAKKGLITGQEAYYQAENKQAFESVKSGMPKHQGVLHAQT